jgi:hypothetical protein
MLNTEQRLNQVADGYRARGYKVVVRPKPADLPGFAKDFHVEMIAIRDDGSVLVSAKKGQSDLEADLEVPRYAEVISKQPGWRFDVIVLGSESQSIPDKRDATEPTEEDIRGALENVERILQAGFVQQAFIAAWAVLESAMRKRLQAEGEEAGWGSSPRTMLNELYSGGVLRSSDFRDLEGLFQARSAIVHGFTSPVIGHGAVPFLIDTARTLLEESKAAKKIA